MKNSASGPKNTVSPMPMALTRPAAFLQIERGSRVYGSPVSGSSVSQTSTSVVSAKNGSMQALSGSGISCMSDSWIAFQPAIEEPSNMMPSANVSSSIVVMSQVTCCHLPRGSVKRKSTYLTSLSLIIFMTFFGVVMAGVPFVVLVESCWAAFRVKRAGERQTGDSDGVNSGFPGPDPDRLLDVRDEDLAVADPAGLRGAADRIDGLFDQVVAEHNLDLHLGEKIGHVLGAAIKFGMAFLPAEALGLGDGDALQTDFLQRLLHLIELERLDDRLDFLHCARSPGSAAGTRAEPSPGFSRSRARAAAAEIIKPDQCSRRRLRPVLRCPEKACAAKIGTVPNPSSIACFASPKA